MKKQIILLLSLVLMTCTPLQAQEKQSFFKRALGKARSVMQSAFQLSFLPKLPVVFHKDSFNTMFKHANDSIDNMNRKYGNRTITRDQFQNDKALHIKKSAELALHIKSLIGSSHLAYGITMVVGLVKEAIDGSFLNPNGSRSKEDIHADHVGAMAVFGKEKFDKSLDKNMGSFVNPAPAQEPVEQGNQSEEEPIIEDQIEIEETTYSAPKQNINQQMQKQELMKKYYRAAEQGDSETMMQIGAQLKALGTAQ